MCYRRSFSCSISSSGLSEIDAELGVLEKSSDAYGNSVKYGFLLRKCGHGNAVEDGRKVHAHIMRFRHSVSRFLGNSLIEMYGKCGCVSDARQVFDHIRLPNVFTWTLMIAAYTQNGHYQEAVELFNRMEGNENSSPDQITFVSILDACSNLGDLQQGKCIHSSVCRRGFQSDVLVGTALVSMYGKCQSTEDAKRVFDGMNRDQVSWNAMIAAYAQNGQSQEAFKLFQEMELEGMKADRITFVSLAEAAASDGRLECAKWICNRVFELGLLSSMLAGNSLVDMFGKCGSPDDARAVFENMNSKNVISWTVMIAAYIFKNRNRDAFQMFREMDFEGFRPNDVTFVTILDACSSLASVALGKLIHGFIVECGYKSDAMVNTALVSMYGKCGSAADSRIVFDGMHRKNYVTWTSLIGAYAHNGQGMEALEILRMMELDGINADSVTFVGVLYGCSHSGLLEESRECFSSMVMDYGITPTAEHYKCMIDLLGRNGWMDEAEQLIKKMPLKPDSIAWTSLLAACVVQRDVIRGEEFAARALEINSDNPRVYVLLSNIYAAVGRWKDAARVRRKLEAKGLKKEPGYSWNNKLHEFYVEDVSHPSMQALYLELWRLHGEMRAAGYVPDKDVMLKKSDEDEEKED